MSEIIAVHPTQYSFCVFVVYDDEDDWTRQELLRLLDENIIRFCCFEKDSNPGQLILDNFNFLLQRSRKVLLVISAEFCRNRQTPLIAEMVLQTHTIEMIITLITDGELSHKNRLFKLTCTKIIQKDYDDWKDKLIKEIRLETPEFCHLLSKGSVSDLLFHRGLCFQNFHSDIFGFSLLVGEKCFRVDLEEFSKHRKIHQKYQTIETCGQCNSLYNVDSCVSIIINTDVPVVDSADKLVESFGRLCQHVCDASSLRSNFSLICTVSGPFQPKQQTLITELYQEVVDNLVFEFTRRLVEPWVPRYVHLEKRIESFQGVWGQETGPPAEKMAKAGFYFSHRPDKAQCFFCGLSRSGWDKDDDPLLVHAKSLPYCSFLQQNLPTEDIPLRRVRRHFVPVEKFKSYLTRKESFENFDVTKYCRGTENEENIKDIDCRLAQCGFFHKGTDTEIMCFSCGLGIFYTDCMTDPWILHASLSSDCPYLRSTRGDSFVETVIQTKRTGNEPTIVNFFLKKYDGRHRLEIVNLFKPSQNYRIE